MPNIVILHAGRDGADALHPCRNRFRLRRCARSERGATHTSFRIFQLLSFSVSRHLIVRIPRPLVWAGGTWGWLLNVSYLESISSLLSMSQNIDFKWFGSQIIIQWLRLFAFRNENSPGVWPGALSELALFPVVNKCVELICQLLGRNHLLCYVMVMGCFHRFGGLTPLTASVLSRAREGVGGRGGVRRRSVALISTLGGRSPA